MVVILGIGLVAAAAQYLFNRAQASDPEGTNSTMRSIRQSTGVLAALVTAVVAVLDALALIRRVLPQTGQNGGPQPPGGKQFGATVAVDAGA